MTTEGGCRGGRVRTRACLRARVRACVRSDARGVCIVCGGGEGVGGGGGGWSMFHRLTN